MSALRTSSFLSGLAATLFGRYGAKALEALMLMAALRGLGAETVGIVFLAESAAGTTFQLIDFGLYTVISRRAARGELARAVLLRLSALRVSCVVAIGLGFLPIAMSVFPEHALIATGFLLSEGLYEVHEPARAALAGQARFGRLASLGVGAKTVEAVITLGGFALGGGVHAWLIGRLVAQLGLALLVYRAALGPLADVPGPAPRARELVREGLPFWLVGAVNTASVRVDSVIVAAWAGLAATAHLGVAARVVGAVLGIVAAYSVVAFPALARDRRRTITRSQVAWVLCVALGLALGVYAAAPLLVRIVMGTAEPAAVQTLRAMVPVLAIFALSWPLSTWLQAKQQERPLALVSLAQAAAGITVAVLLTRSFGPVGAAWGRVARAAVELTGLGGLTLIVLRGERARGEPAQRDAGGSPEPAIASAERPRIR